MSGRAGAPRRRAAKRGVVVLMAVWSAGGGCAQPDADQSVPDPDSRISSPAPPGVDTMQVLMDEYSISMPATVPAGPHPMRFVNAGFEEHNIYFREKGSDTPAWVLERRLNPGERRVMTVELAPGAYTAICDFSGHDGRGMFVDFTVEPTPAREERPDSVAPAL